LVAQHDGKDVKEGLVFTIDKTKLIDEILFSTNDACRFAEPVSIKKVKGKIKAETHSNTISLQLTEAERGERAIERKYGLIWPEAEEPPDAETTENAEEELADDDAELERKGTDAVETAAEEGLKATTPAQFQAGKVDKKLEEFIAFLDKKVQKHVINVMNAYDKLKEHEEERISGKMPPGNIRTRRYLVAPKEIQDSILRSKEVIENYITARDMSMPFQEVVHAIANIQGQIDLLITEGVSILKAELQIAERNNDGKKADTIKKKLSSLRMRRTKNRKHFVETLKGFGVIIRDEPPETQEDAAMPAKVTRGQIDEALQKLTGTDVERMKQEAMELSHEKTTPPAKKRGWFKRARDESPRTMN